MKTTIEVLEPTCLSVPVAAAAVKSRHALNLAGVYQDGVTRDWAMQSFERPTPPAGEVRGQNAWFSVSSLSNPRILLAAVRAAALADVIVVSVSAADELPASLEGWIDAWLPLRRSRTGALAVLIGLAAPLDAASVRMLEYLQSVARQARLDFIPQERPRPVASPAPAGGFAEQLHELCGHRSLRRNLVE